MNDDLCPDEFEICVPKKCGLLGSWTEPDDWHDYLRTLVDDDDELPGVYRNPRNMPCSCTCDGKEGWKLTGEMAIRHACRVHDKIHRQILGFDQVSAVDVGFAIWERQTEFGNFLAIRAHVNKKRSPEELARLGMANLTLPFYAFLRSDSQNFGLRGLGPAEPVGDDRKDQEQVCRKEKEQAKNLWRILRNEIGNKKRIRRELDRYPISGVTGDDLSIFCPREILQTRTIRDIRLCICGVPIDIVNASYSPSIIHPGGDADSGVFAKSPRRTDRLPNKEQLLIGRGRVNPLVGGVSVGTVTGQAGTLSTIVWDRTDGTPCVLSNWHVLAGTQSAQVGQPVYQPALFDGGTTDDVVANLKRWSLGEDGDAAIAELTGYRYYASGEVLGLWHSIAGYLKPELNMEIRKWGRTTGYTQGFVDGICLAANIDYGGGVVRYFRDQFHIAPLYLGDDVSQVGDSGSLVVTSFRPLELRQDLETVLGWLRQACEAQVCETLCAELPETLKCLIKQCKELSHCEEICQVLEGFGQQIESHCSCAASDCTEICNTVKKWKEDLDGKCQVICDRVRRCRFIEGQLERIYEKYCWNFDVGEKARKELKGVVAEIDKDRWLLERCTGIRGRLKDDLGSCDLCDLIEDLLHCLRRCCEELEACQDFCNRVRSHFRAWAKRCKRCTPDEKPQPDISRLCRILASKCRHLECKDPADLVKCIRKELEKLESQPRKTPGEESVREEAAGDGDENGGEDDGFAKKWKEELKKVLGLVGLKSEQLDENLFLSLLETELTKKEGESVLDDWFNEKISQSDTLKELARKAKAFLRRRRNRQDRNVSRVYYAVGQIFAGDTPGSPFGEFAVASDISRLARRLRFSLRPVFEPRSSFRELRVRPQGQRQDVRALPPRRGLVPGDQLSDPRGGGPQPEIEPFQSGPGDSGG